MTVPPKDDPRWKALVQGSRPYALKGLATRMLLTRVRLIGARGNDAALEHAIRPAS